MDCESPQEMYQPQPIAKEDPKKAAWKYEGYPAFSAWMDESFDFFVLRRFGAMNARVLLMMQDAISEKENELLAEDQRGTWDPSKRIVASNQGDAEGVYHALVIMDPNLTKDVSSDDYINTYSALKSKLPATAHQKQNVRNWLKNHEGAVYEDDEGNEQDFINHEGDLIALVTKPRVPFRTLIESSEKYTTSRIFRAKPTSSNTDSNLTKLSSDIGLEWTGMVIMIALGLVLLFAPMWWLAAVSNDAKRLGIITGFVFIFAVILVLSTPPDRPYEALAAIAAYTAVLTVFLGNANNAPFSI